jgi:hypothetical protein
MKSGWTILAASAALLLPVAALRADGPIPTDKQKVPPKKVITEDDLRSAGRPQRGTVSVGTPDAPPEAKDAKGGEAKPAGTASPSPEPTESEKREARQQELQKEIDYQAANIRTLQDQVNQAQAELNDLSDMTFSPAGSSTGRRTALMKKIDDANAQIQASRDTIQQLEDQARQAGVRVSVP